jgi:hypothetical protein
MKGMKRVVIYLTTYSFHGYQKFTNSSDQLSLVFKACAKDLEWRNMVIHW